MKSYEKFLYEFNRKDKDFIKDMSDHFTISIEYELVADFDIEDEPFLETEKEVNRALKFVRNQVLLDMSRGKIGYRFDDQWKLPKKKLQDNEKRLLKEHPNIAKLGKRASNKLHQEYVTWTWVNQFIDYLIDRVDVDDEYLTDDRINRPWGTDVDDYIATLILKNINMFIYSQNMGFLIDNFKKYMPKFYKKYHNTFKYELEADMDKQRILEFSSKTYLKSLNECFEQIEEFYDEFDKQDFWKMDNDRTALHVNIGINDKKTKWNPLKGLILMGDMNRDKKTPFVFTDIMWRCNNRFTQSLLDGIKRNLTGEIEQDYIDAADDEDRMWNLGFRHKDRLDTHRDYIKQNLDKLDTHNIKQTEDFLNPFLIRANKDFYIKEFGIKLIELENQYGYVEFRYVGGVVSKEVFMDKILYFCYIVYLMTNNDYSNKDYQKKLYKFVENMKEMVSEKIRWYSDGKLGDAEESDILTNQIKIGDKVELTNNLSAMWDNAHTWFVDSNYNVGFRFGGARVVVMDIKGDHICARMTGRERWYKVSCLEAI